MQFPAFLNRTNTFKAHPTMFLQKLFGALLGLICLPSVLLAGAANAKGIEFFESKIRPVLSKYCYECHSAQAKKLKADLLLDSKEGMLKGGDSGPVMAPGKAKGSLLIKALEHDGPTKMPSQSTKLSKEIIADFVKWIDMGAPDPRASKAAAKKRTIDIDKGRQFWAFQPLASVAPPAVKNATWSRTPIDRFILAKLEEKGLTPNPPIGRERLIRRAYFDLHGLPPTPAEVEAFVKDTAPDAYDKLIDRLVQSEHVGERWARHWLDTVRFAESGGYEFDGNRPAAFHYRDFVIKAFNQDMPFDQFIRWQIAGDHLVPGDLSAISATGFLVAGSYPGQTTSKTLSLIRYDHLDDMVSTLGTSMLGLSLGCARCHEHKYDPIPQEDYYRMIAALGRTDSANLKVNTEPEVYKKAKATFDRAHAPFLKARDQFEQSELPKFLQTFWNANKDKPAPAWLTLAPVAAKGKSKLEFSADGVLTSLGKGQKNETYTIVAHTMQRKIKALRLEALADKSLPKSGPGQSPDGGFVLTEINVVATPLNAAVKAKIKPINVKLKAGQASAQDPKFQLAAALDGNPKTGWSVGNLTGKDQAARFDFEGDVGFDGGTVLTITLKFDNDNYAIARPRLAITTTASAPLTGAAEQQTATELLTALRPTQGVWKTEQRTAIAPWARKLDSRAEEVYGAIDRHDKAEPPPKLVDVFAAQSGRGGDVNFLIRGEVEKKREIAKTGFVQVLMTPTEREKHWLSPLPPGKGPKSSSPLPPGEGPGVRGKPAEPRVALANWITDADHGAGHLLARVIVNRLWQHHMGHGIVGTPNDFGVQGDAPTHPELLDYLARELIKNGWRLKPIHKLIMTSAVYMQSNKVNPTNLTLDSQNHLWWRHPTRRLEAEAVRDNILAVGGTLDPKMYGPGTLDGNSPRRSVYLTVKRSQMIPLLQMFDVPEALQSIGERSVTTVPTQSLAFMNSPLVRGAAQKLAVRVRAKTDAESIDKAYLIALARRPTDAERQRMSGFIAREAKSYGKMPQARDQALTDFCQVLLCLNEFIYVD
jgi:hypothetical protein